MSDFMENELKPCPFCGSTAIYYEWTPKTKNTRVTCTKCHAEIVSLLESGYTAFLLWNSRNETFEIKE